MLNVIPIEIIYDICDHLDIHSLIKFKNLNTSMQFLLTNYCKNKLKTYLIDKGIEKTYFDNNYKTLKIIEIFLISDIISLIAEWKNFFSINFINVFIKKGYYNISKNHKKATFLLYNDIDFIKIENVLKTYNHENKTIKIYDNNCDNLEPVKMSDDIYILKTQYFSDHKIHNQTYNQTPVSSSTTTFMITYDVFV